MWRDRNPRNPASPRDDDERGDPSTGGTAGDGKPVDGAFQALDQMANWVRFADTKATILTAGLGVALTMLMTHSDTIAAAIREGCVGAVAVGGLAAGAALAATWTLFWLVRAIGPRRTICYPHPNRFAWPSLVGVNADQLSAHAVRVHARDDAWQQVTDLAALADSKFTACGRAVWGFAGLVVLGVGCIALAVGIAF